MERRKQKPMCAITLSLGAASPNNIVHEREHCLEARSPDLLQRAEHQRMIAYEETIAQLEERLALSVLR